MAGAKFIPKELRQIEHFFKRETDDEIDWWLNNTCPDICCIDDTQELEFSVDDLEQYDYENLYDKFKDMAKRYNLHVTTDWGGGFIFAAKKGVNDGDRSKG